MKEFSEVGSEARSQTTFSSATLSALYTEVRSGTRVGPHGETGGDLEIFTQQLGSPHSGRPKEGWYSMLFVVTIK